jgi:tetratricopeptide (TPR) repeat protein
MKKTALLVFLVSLTAYSYSQTPKAEWYAEQGRLAITNKKYKEAIKLLDTAINMDASKSLVYLNRGVAKGKLEEYVEALADYDKAIEMGEDRFEVWYNRGVAKYFLKDYTNAIPDFEKAVKHDSTSADSYLFLGYSTEFLESYPASVAYLSKAIKPAVLPIAQCVIYAWKNMMQPYRIATNRLH